jgi:large subunit ribosomal protein L30
VPKTSKRQDGRTAGKKPAAKPKRAARPKAEAKAATGAQLVVKQIRSGIGHAETYRRTLIALGLRHHQAVVTVNDNPSIRGMLHKVHHLVSVKPAGTGAEA